MDVHEDPTVSSGVPASGVPQQQQLQQTTTTTSTTTTAAARRNSASDTTSTTGTGATTTEDGSHAGSVWSSSSFDSNDDDDDDDNDDFLKTESSMEAAALVTYQQMMQGKPILLGRNKQDNTCNVQLPSGRVIVVESSAFPEFKPPPLVLVVDGEPEVEDAAGAQEEEDEERPAPSLLQDPHWRRYIGTASSSSQHGGKSHKGSSSSKNNQPLPQQQPQQPMRRTQSSATVSEIARAIPSAASCVFHILDRRVNLDQHDCHDGSNYALLRAWVQDDPYRVRPTRAAAPRWRSTSGTTPAVATRHPTPERRAIEEDERQRKPTTKDVIAALNEMPPVSRETLKSEWIRNAKRIKREKIKECLARDQVAVESLKQRLGLKL